jgi:hypothetical protein
VELSTKEKGDIAELAVAADLTKRGHQVALPFGNRGHYDLLVDRASQCTCKTIDPTGRAGCDNCVPDYIERVQVKYTVSDEEVIKVRTRCHSVTAGRVISTVQYTERDIDWIAVYDASTDFCYYVPAYHLGDGKGILHLRIKPTKNNQDANVRWAHDYMAI